MSWWRCVTISRLLQSVWGVHQLHSHTQCQVWCDLQLFLTTSGTKWNPSKFSDSSWIFFLQKVRTKDVRKYWKWCDYQLAGCWRQLKQSSSPGTMDNIIERMNRRGISTSSIQVKHSSHSPPHPALSHCLAKHSWKRNWSSGCIWPAPRNRENCVGHFKVVLAVIFSQATVTGGGELWVG